MPLSRACRSRSGRPSAGQTMVEFAVVLPLLLVMMFSIIDFGYYMFLVISVNNGTRAAVRRAAMNNITRDQIQQVVMDSAIGAGVSAAAISITTQAADDTLPGRPSTVTVTTQYPHRFFAAGLLPVNSLDVRSTYKSIITTYPGRANITF
jgi:Flp pilus assembly protein TadG